MLIMSKPPTLLPVITILHKSKKVKVKGSHNKLWQICTMFPMDLANLLPFVKPQYSPNQIKPQAAFMIISLLLSPLLLWHLGPGPPLYSSLLILLPLILLLGVFPSRALVQAITTCSQGGMIWSKSISISAIKPILKTGGVLPCPSSRSSACSLSPPAICAPPSFSRNCPFTPAQSLLSFFSFSFLARCSCHSSI